ncbi:hypothetical protein PDR5_46170 [Pseudomonas sp. DR 5-09]|nr:hypothetical protein PDR5_46170 [Pseudomonas sp. DR 5-09]
MKRRSATIKRRERYFTSANRCRECRPEDRRGRIPAIFSQSCYRSCP